MVQKTLQKEFRRQLVMLSFTNKLLMAIVLGLIFVPAVLAQTPTPTPAKSNDEGVTERQFKTKIFELKYRDPNSIASVLRQLGSGFKGSGIGTSSEFKTLSVRDFPENIVTIEEAIKRLDTPAPPRPSIELHMHVLLASNRGGAATGADVPNELKDVLTQLRGTLTYKNYELYTSVLQRISESNRLLTGSGVAQLAGAQSGTTPSQYEYSINQVSISPGQPGGSSIQILEFVFSVAGEGVRGRVQTSLNLKDGEKVVVGTATINDRALIVVLIPKVIN